MNTQKHLALTILPLAVLAAAILSVPWRTSRAADGDSAKDVFEKRIMPIFNSPNPSSCTQCHLAGVDLKNYILPSHEKTFVSLRDQGLIDVKEPMKSKILKLINMREEDRAGANLIHDKTRKLEYDAFAEWVKASCADPKLRDAPKLDPAERAQTARPVEVVRHARKDRLLESFEKNVWAMRFRCMSCHIEGTPENKKLVDKHGERVAWMKAAGPAATMNYLVRDTKLVNLKEPEKSLLLLKPLGEVKHEGGKKFLPGDQGYKAFRSWIEDYAAIVGDRYEKAADIPKDDAAGLAYFGSEIWLKLTETRPEWDDKLLAVTVYAWDAKKKAWETTPIAMSDRGVWGKGKLWQHTLVLIAPKNSQRAQAWKKQKPSLPNGRYLVRIHVDTTGKLGSDWKAELGKEDYAGQAEVTSNWPEGYGRMTTLSAAKVKR